MAGKIGILDPRGRPKAAKFDLAPRPRRLEGLNIGLLDNGKSNADVIMERLREILSARYRSSNVFIKPRRPPGVKYQYRVPGQKDGFVEEMASQSDVVVNGVGD